MEKQTANLRLVSAFLAMEPTGCVISHACNRLLNSKPRSLGGGGSMTEDVQRFVWDHCISGAIGKCHALFLKNFLKKLILEIESNRDDVLDELYELYTEFMTSLKDENAVKGNVRALKYISFLFPNDASYEDAMVRKLVIPLHCSLDMLEGDTGCSIWPASLFLSEFRLSFPDMFSSKTCFQVGSGVGLVGIRLTHVKASKVKCLHLPWECASESELRELKPDIVADMIDYPLCLPHLVRVLSILLDKTKSSSQFPRVGCDSAIGSSHDYSDGCDYRDVVAACESAGNAGITEHPMA